MQQRHAYWLRHAYRRTHGAAYIEYLVLISASMAISLGTIFTLLPIGLRFYHSYTLAAHTPHPAHTPGPTPPAHTPPFNTPSPGGTPNPPTLPVGDGPGPSPGSPTPPQDPSPPTTTPSPPDQPGIEDIPDGGATTPESPQEDTPEDADADPDGDKCRQITIPATPATPATPNGPGQPATPATPATPAQHIRCPDHPHYGGFDFGERVFAWNNTTWRTTSPYVDIQGVADTPVPYTVTGQGRPAAQANVDGGPKPEGTLRHGTDLQIDVPPPGGSHLATLHINGQSGTFLVRTEPIPDQIVHHDGWLWLWVPVHWEGRSFSISGQGTPGAQPNGGNTRPSAALPDGRITQGVAHNGFNLVVATPRPGHAHRVIITIEGHSSNFRVLRP